MSFIEDPYMLLFRQSPWLNARGHFVIFSGWQVRSTHGSMKNAAVKGKNLITLFIPQIDSTVDIAFVTFVCIVTGCARHILSTARWRMEWTNATNVAPPAKRVATSLSKLLAIFLWAAQAAVGCVIVLLVNSLHWCVFSGVAVGSALGYWLAGTGCFGMSAGSCPTGEALIWA